MDFKILPSIHMANGKTEAIIHGCMWYIISTGFLIPILDFCSKTWTQVHLNPLDAEAKSNNINPRKLNCVDLYVNSTKPIVIIITIPDRLQDWNKTYWNVAPSNIKFNQIKKNYTGCPIILIKTILKFLTWLIKCIIAASV